MSSKVRIEDGLVIGTASDKYDSGNPLARWLVGQFDAAVSDFARQADPKTVLEVGCGEGHIVELLLQATSARIHATDISATCVAEAQANVSSDRVTFATQNVMTMTPPEVPPQMVVCCEVLEHLDAPQRGLDALAALNAEYYLLSVPREPLWRVLNFSRGVYMKEWGNSPGHFQHWSKRGFLRFIGRHFTPVAVRSPIPWTVVLCRPNAR
ncbi:class I SAM-dependent methyltransferase [Aureimonas mangrovi]|uniref:class I SAM-dependent methyltransferase n=1 Tax=Aureimonas mangrovi TaxID=2758041 RepID=UPI00163DC598|nr:class I SAM-dependent methyltransferase [Aureimonas mangrovi]